MNILLVVCLLIATAAFLILSIHTKLTFAFERNPFRNIKPRKLKIPKIIIKTGPLKKSNFPPDFQADIERMLSENPTYKLEYFEDSECVSFIKEHFKPEVLAAYNKLNSGAYQADLFRYCALYVKGGIYLDLACFPLSRLSENVDHMRDELVVPYDKPRHLFYRAYQICFMASIPRHPLMRKLIEAVCKNVKNETYGLCPLSVTGPLLFGKFAPKKQMRNELIQKENHLVHVRTGRWHFIRKKQYQPPLYESDYDEKWNKRQIFKKT